jgi:hypothetical protein
MDLDFTVDVGDPLSGSLFYEDRAHSFRFVPGSPQELEERSGRRGLTSLSVGTLQIEVGVETRLALFVWGLAPKARWKTGGLDGPKPQPGIVHVTPSRAFSRGVSISVAEVGHWDSLFDETTGWLRVSAEELSDTHQILIATDTVLGLRDKSLTSVWLQPVFE